MLKRKIFQGRGKVLATILAGSLLIGPTNFLERAYAQEQKAERVEDEKPEQYTIIKDHILDFQRRYLQRVSQRSNSFKKRVKKHGFDEFVEIYSQNHILLLDAAFEDRESKEDLERIVGKIARNMGADGGPVNYQDLKFLERLEDWSEIRIEYFNKLLEPGKPREKGSDGFREIFNKAYDADSLEKYLEKQHSANEKLYDAMQGTLTGLSWLFSDKEFDPIREETKRIYESLNGELENGES